jgi:membrane-associated protease RseP (regulator of RpoE activity)
MNAKWRWFGGAGLAIVIGMGSAAAQVVPGERTRQPSADEAPRTGGREGGIPRSQVGAARAGGDAKDGQEEGVPEIQPRFAPGGGALPRIAPPRGDWKLGVWGYNTESGVVVTRVAPGSAAARVGIENGDKIVSVGGYQIGYVGDLLYPLGFELQRQAGSRGDVLLLVQNVRNRELQHLTAQLDRGGRPPRPLERQ